MNLPPCPSTLASSSFTGERGIRHSVDMTADTLYEAAAQAVAMFKQCRSERHTSIY